MSYKDGNGDFVPRYLCYLTNRRVKVRKIRNFREKVIFTKVDMMGINRLETMSVVRLTYS
ncbi:hypothetical protein T4E_5981 [Trichinella pseudospiralis]|uniref:Uncharacterized protein n=1 Tax=Trichinella pseudospiralis TaxID=6337 RepID=A0A0V0XLN3_TRIPS|nr:hypothetical protein T4E_5981 [Trichinella pseudospiralis]